MVISYVFLIFVREGEWNIPVKQINRPDTTVHYRTLLRRDKNFRWFLVVRILFQFANMGVGFYTVYAVKEHGISGSMAGYLTALMTFALMIGSPLAGWYGDRKGHRLVLGMGALAASVSALCAWLAPAAGWFYLVYVLAGLANVGTWTPVLSMTLQFGHEVERPVYIGLANTLVAPFAIFAPLLGGWLADMAGYPVTFIVSLVGGLLTACVVFFFLRDPRAQESREHGAISPESGS